MSLKSQLDEGVSALGINLPEGAAERLLQYLALMEKWGKVYNLTAICKPEEMLSLHLFDSLVILPYISGPFIADVGSGAGLPGVPLALARPDWRVVLFESNQKKAIFLQQARIELNLKNIEVIAGRVENFSPRQMFDTVVSRAFSGLADYVQQAGHLCKEAYKGGIIVAMKGKNPRGELAQIPEQFVIKKISSVIVPGLGAERHLVFINRN
ncbi:MAG: 16S rRNA (guanine(527)-N(7))-methyltransferase RsmG [Nitrosomonadaceae bacterium]|nr:16S rRNA (guanine(527)-N(7))-methyltransferase RsmG [Nitrosomonadaceae bacterium]